MSKSFNQNSVRVNISNCIKEYVYTNNTTYRDLAQKANVTHTKLSQYVHLATTPSLETLLKLCEAMDVSLNEMTGIKPYYQYENLLDSLEETIASFENEKGE